MINLEEKTLSELKELAKWLIENKCEMIAMESTASYWKPLWNIFENNGFNTQILAASFKNSLQVLELCEYGVGAATVAPDIIEGFINNTTNVQAAVQDFTDDFEKLCGEGKTMLNCD